MREIGGRVLGEVSEAAYGRSRWLLLSGRGRRKQREIQRRGTNGLMEENRTRVLGERRKEERAEECDARQAHAR
jgi:hypothetical protein